MRVVTTAPAGPARGPRTARAARAANVELLALLACSMVVLLGLYLTLAGRLEQLGRTAGDARVNLLALQSPDELLPLLPMFEQRTERQVVARALYARAVSQPRLTHVGGLARVTLPAAQVRGDRRLVELGARLAARDDVRAVAVLTPADLASLKPMVVVRGRGEYLRAVGRACAHDHPHQSLQSHHRGRVHRHQRKPDCGRAPDERATADAGH